MISTWGGCYGDFFSHLQSTRSRGMPNADHLFAHKVSGLKELTENIGIVVESYGSLSIWARRTWMLEKITH